MSSKDANSTSLEQLAASKLTREIYDFFAGGADDEETLHASADDWRGYKLRPRVLRDVSEVEISTSVLGTAVSTPIGIAPVGYQGLLHEDGELETAIGAARTDSLFTVSSRASMPLHEIAAAAPGAPRWFQVYMMQDRGITEDLIVQAKELGYSALVLTADMPVLARRLRDVGNGFVLPPSISSDSRIGVTQSGGNAQSPSVTFDDIGWLHGITGLPVVVKGVLRADDAMRCVDAGARAVWVSAHGGRQLDGSITPASALPDVAAAVGRNVEVYVDGGIRRGVDVLRAIALGASHVFVGRLPMWGLAISGANGVVEAIDGLSEELIRAMALCGTRSLSELSRDLVV